jgi:hypothetical protein
MGNWRNGLMDNQNFVMLVIVFGGINFVGTVLESVTNYVL